MTDTEAGKAWMRRRWPGPAIAVDDKGNKWIDGGTFSNGSRLVIKCSPEHPDGEFVFVHKPQERNDA